MKKITLFLFAIVGMSIISKGDYWTQKSSCPMMRKTCFSFSIGLKGYTGCGRDSLNNLTNSFWEYDQVANSWAQKADFAGVSREGAIGFSVGNKGYAGLGINVDLGGALQDFYEYDTANNQWSQKAFFQGMGSAYSACFSIGNYGYVCTGTNMSQDYQELWQYDPSNDSWNQKTGITGIARQQAMGFSIGLNGYICGGYNLIDSSLLNDLWQYNPNTNSWTQKANTPGHPRCDAATFTILGKGYLGIGDTAGGDIKDFWQYDTAQNQWTKKADFPGIRRDEATYFSIGDKGYVGLGGEAGNFNDFWEYTPDSSTGINDITHTIKTTLYPTPFKDKTTLIIEGNLINGTLTIYNIQGQIIKRLFIENKTTGQEQRMVITRDNFSEGIYLYELSNENSQILAAGKMLVE